MKDYINRIIQGDCRDILKEFPDNSIDSCVTDPPYGLSEHDEGVIRDVLGKWLNGQDDYVPHKRGFMGNEWDAFVPPPVVWREVYRVLKPGAHILVFAGTRTQDLMSMSLRLAGFEVRDVLMWLYSSGFPKSLNISKAIDKQLGAKREKTGVDSKFGRCDSGIYNFNVNNPPKMQFDRYDIPATPEAEQWEGWGTALKPAYEPIILARKPISEKNIALNVLKWGVGGINIDACRVSITDDDRKRIKSRQNKKVTVNHIIKGFGNTTAFYGDWELSKGRFPANVLLECICDEVIEGKAGIKTPRSNIKHGTGKGSTYLLFKESGEHYKNEVGTIHTNPECPCYMLDGQSNVSASRFFYVSKASKSERLGIDKIEIILYNISNNNSEEDILCKGKTLIQGEKLVQLQVDMDILPPKVIVEYGMQNKNVLEWSMSWFGKNIMDKYQKDFASIILTETNLTITSKIYNWLVFLLTNEYIVDVNLLMENGGNLVENANNLKELIISINKIMASRLGVKSVISNPLLKISVKEEKITHCTQKPIKLMEYLVHLITPAGGIVLDPFAGSGSTCIACKKLGYKYIGIEISEEYCEIARNRIGAIPDTIFTIPPQEE